MVPHNRYARGALWYLICLFMVLIAFPQASYAQDLPAIPHRLSEGVQARASELKIWADVAKGSGFNPSAFPVYYTSGSGLVPLHVYLDDLAAVDVMAKRRADTQGKESPDIPDYDMMFASWCFFVPNKPPLTESSKEILESLRKRLIGMYLNSSKRQSLAEAMRPLLLNGSLDDLFRVLYKLQTPEEFNRVVLDTTLLEK